MATPSAPLMAAVDALAGRLWGVAGIDAVSPEIDAAGNEFVLVTTSDPRAASRVVPTREGGFPVRLRAAATGLVQARPAEVPAPPVAYAPAPIVPVVVLPAPMTRTTMTDEALWDAIETMGDPLGGLSFEEAVARDPLRVEALVHQRIHRAFHDILGLETGMRGSEAGFYQRESFLMHCRSAREGGGGRATSRSIADVLELNWETYSQLLDAGVRQALGNPVAMAWFTRLANRADDLRAAFAEACRIAGRAAEVAAVSGREVDAAGWRSVSCVTRNMGDFTLDRMLLPVRRGGAPQVGEGRAAGRIGPGGRRLLPGD